jgi:uncharacterized protein (DUF58 family)
MTFGTADRRKADVAEGVAVAMGHIATQRGNRLGLVTFGGRSDRRLPARGGRDGLLAVLLTSRNDGDEGDAGDAGDAASGGVPVRPVGSLESALQFVAAAATRGGLVAVVSDFRGSRDWRRPLAAVAARHHVLAIEVRDPREDVLPDVGDLTLIDAESGRQVRVDTSSRRLRERFAEAASADRASLTADLRRVGVGHVVLSTSGSWLRSLAAQLRVLGIAS